LSHALKQLNQKLLTKYRETDEVRIPLVPRLAKSVIQAATCLFTWDICSYVSCE